MPRLPRFFIAPDQVVDDRIVIIGEDVRHISTVLRMKPGEQLLLCDGRGRDYTVSITGSDRTSIATRVLSAVERSLPSPRITLCQGVPKSDKMDLIMQKATELGVAAVIPVVTERTIVKLRDEEKRVSRWQKICREAAMQSDRADIPEVVQVVRLQDLLRIPRTAPGTLLLLPWEEGTRPVKQVLQGNRSATEIFVIIGPEGGLSAKEAALAQDAGFHPVSLGRNILRTETAALAVLSMIQYEYGM